MRCQGARSGKPGSLSWVRPLHTIIATFGPQTEEPDTVKFSVEGIETGQTTCTGIASLRRGDPGASLPRTTKQSCSPEKSCSIPKRPQGVRSSPTPGSSRSRRGLSWSRTSTARRSRQGLVEWPVVLMGSFGQEFLKTSQTKSSAPRSAITRNVLWSAIPKRASSASKFILVANIEATDGDIAIIAGNERVIRARLSDSKFFLETDLEAKARGPAPEVRSDRVPREAGTQAARVARIERLAAEIAPVVRR